MSNLRQLAESLGLSITTVSRALDGYSDVSARTRLRVRAAADEAGYQPNAAARRLRRQKAELVAVTLPSTHGQIGPPHFLDILSDCAEHLAQAGLNLIIAPVPRGQSELEICRRLVDGQRVEAMVLVRTKLKDERVTFLQSRNMPFVTHGRTQAEAPHAFIDGDGLLAFKEATLRFARDGHVAVAHIAGPQEYSFANLRFLGWHTAMVESGLPTNLLAIGEPSERGGYDAARALMSAPLKPTAILCATDEMAIGALRALREVENGEQVCVVGHDDLPTGAYTEPPLSSMRMKGTDFGAKLASLLLRAIAGEPPGALQEIYPVEFVPRASHQRWPRPAGSAWKSQ